MECNKKNDLIDSYKYHEGRYKEYIDYLYSELMTKFVSNHVIFHGKRVVIEKEEAVDGKRLRFWHLISEGYPEDNREYIPDRARRLHWIGHILDSSDCEMCENLFWYKEEVQHKIYILCEDAKYLIVLLEMRKYYILKSAYLINDKKIERIKSRAIQK